MIAKKFMILRVTETVMTKIVTHSKKAFHHTNDRFLTSSIQPILSVFALSETCLGLELFIGMQL